MKLKSIHVKNLGNVQEFSANISGGINYIVACNGGNKTTIGITSVWACLQGVAERGTQVLKGKRSMWVGRFGTDAEIEIVLTDPEGIEYVVNRKISENRLEITASDGRKLDQKWIDSFWNAMMLSPIAFSRLTPKEQAQCMGIDTSEFDRKVEELKAEAQGIRAIVKNFGEIELPEKIDPVDVAELSREKDRIVAFNQAQDSFERERAKYVSDIFEADRQIGALREKIAEIEKDKERAQVVLAVTPIPRQKMLADEVDQKISEAAEVNAKAIVYEQVLKKRQEKAAKELELVDNKALQDAEIAKKINYMQALDLPFTNLAIDDVGGLMMDGRPIQEPYFSAGERIKICTMLLASRAPDWKYVFLEQFDLLDDVKSKEVLDWLLNNDFQVLAERVGNQKEVVILQDVR